MTMFVTFVFCYLCVFCVTADRMYYHPYEYRSVPSDKESNALSFTNSNIQTNHGRQPQIIHTSQSKIVKEPEKVQTYSNSFNEIQNKIDHLPKSDEKMQNTRSEDVNGRTPLVYTKPTFESWIPYPEKSIFLEPARTNKEMIEKITPTFDLLEPVTAKMSNKVTGLMDLVLSLAGSSSNNFLMKGFKQILIDGIIKPMLVAKGGLKVLISKLSIPLISVLLINIEVLITVWWLWEDCTDQLKPVNKPVNTPVNTLIDTGFRKTS